jgi:TatD DNase family protein
VWWAAGLHPYYADQSSDAVWRDLIRIGRHPRFVAVGEIGLDYAKCPIPADVQIAAFERGLTAADELKKPVIIHCREAYADLMPILRRRGPATGAVPGVVHCFSGNSEQAREIRSLGYFLGVDGPVTYPGAKALREALSAVSLNAFVLETDSPYLPPQSRRGQRNEPSCLPEIGVRLAEHLGASVPEATRVWTENARQLYRL